MLTSCLTTIKNHVIKYCEKVYERSGKNLFWSIKNSSEVLNKLKSRGFRASSLSTYDFSTLYTTLPHNLIKDKLVDLIERTFQRECSLYRYHKLRKAFTKFYRRHFDIVSKYNVGLKTLLLQGLSEPEFYGDLVYKFRKIIGKNDFPYHFKKIVVRYKKIGYNINVMRQRACLVVNPIKVNSFAYLFNWTTVGRTSD